MNKFISVILAWVPFAITVTLLCGIIYVTVHQNYRQTVNDPQYQMAEDAAFALSTGADPKSLVPSSPPVELSRSLAPFLIIYDEKEEPVVSEAVLNGKVPKLPFGVLDYVKRKGEEMVTWQPDPGVREALVIKKSEGNRLYFVVAGRSLRKVEDRVVVLNRHIFLGWFFSLVILFIVVWLQKIVTKEKT